MTAMAEVGCFLCSEEHGPRSLVASAQQAEEAGFAAVMISDHYHPWTDRQGESPFVWSVIGAIAASTGLRVTTGVTCPTVRIHPAVIAQAAATSQLLLDGRFSFGVGSGEALNEHITGTAGLQRMCASRCSKRQLPLFASCGRAGWSTITVSTTPLKTPASIPCLSVPRRS